MDVETLEARRLFANVTALVLVNADTGKDIGVLKNGAVVNLATLPTRRLSIRAGASGDTESLKFRLDGKSHTENIAPYALAGNDGNDYESWTPKTGSHQLSATAYTRDNARGSSKQVALTFKVVDERLNPEPNPQPQPKPEPQPQPQPQPTDVTPPNIPGTWKIDWADEFNDQSVDGWKTNIWWSPDGAAGRNVGDERTSASNVTVAGGNLNLTATKSGSLSYTSGLVTSEGLHEFQYGYVESRMQIPKGKGMWPAFWMLPASHDDGAGEIDVMEVVGDEPWMFHMNYHVDGPYDDAESTDVGFDLSAAFHTFAVDWQKDSITWYLDGKPMHRAANHTHEPLYVILNLAVGGDWPGSPNSSTQFPSRMNVDYVRVWEKVA